VRVPARRAQRATRSAFCTTCTVQDGTRAAAPHRHRPPKRQGPRTAHMHARIGHNSAAPTAEQAAAHRAAPRAERRQRACVRARVGCD
jgi:hypothetical protein